MILSQDEAVALAAGASTGIIADVALFPLDFLKTHAQGNASSSKSASAASPNAAAAAAAPSVPECGARPATERLRPGYESLCGVQSRLAPGCAPRPLRSLYGGLAALAMGSMPSSAGFFVVYEIAKKKLKLKAAIAESSACVIRNPFEVVKQQVQLGLHPTTVSGFKAVWRHEGPGGFFVGMGTSMLRDVPFAMLQLSIWEWMKVKALGENPPSTRYSAVVSGAAGMVAGAVAAVMTTPMDVAKTRLMTQEPGARRYNGFCHCLTTMLRTEGLPSLFLGVKMRCLWVALGGGIFLGGYDAFKAWYRQVFERHSFFQPQTCCQCSHCDCGTEVCRFLPSTAY